MGEAGIGCGPEVEGASRRSRWLWLHWAGWVRQAGRGRQEGQQRRRPQSRAPVCSSFYDVVGYDVLGYYTSSYVKTQDAIS